MVANSSDMKPGWPGSRVLRAPSGLKRKFFSLPDFFFKINRCPSQIPKFTGPGIKILSHPTADPWF